MKSTIIRIVAALILSVSIIAAVATPDTTDWDELERVEHIADTLQTAIPDICRKA